MPHDINNRLIDDLICYPADEPDFNECTHDDPNSITFALDEYPCSFCRPCAIANLIIILFDPTYNDDFLEPSMR